MDTTTRNHDCYRLRRPDGTTWDGTTIKLVMHDGDGRVRGERPVELHSRHSPTGWSWGYAGSGPAQAALDILWDWMGEEPHPAAYQDFKDGFLSDPYLALKSELLIPVVDVAEFIRQRDPLKTFMSNDIPHCGDCGEPMFRDSNGIARCRIHG
jgi:hypothetical protein